MVLLRTSDSRPRPRSTDGSIRDQAAVSPAVARLLRREAIMRAACMIASGVKQQCVREPPRVLASGPTVHDAGDCLDRGDVAERTSATASGCRTNQRGYTKLTRAVFGDLVGPPQPAEVDSPRPKSLALESALCRRCTKSRGPRGFVRQPRDEALARVEWDHHGGWRSRSPAIAFAQFRSSAGDRRRGRRRGRRAWWSVESWCVAAASSGRFGSLLVSWSRRGNRLQ